MQRPPQLSWALAAAAFAAAGCTALADVDRFGATLEDPANKYRTLDFSITDMETHRMKYFELRLIDKNGWTQFLAISDPFEPDPFARFVAPNVVPKANPEEYRLDFFGDMNESRAFNVDDVRDAGGKLIAERDHSWRIEGLDRERGSQLAIRPGAVVINYEHNYQFADLSKPAQTPDTSAGDAIIDLTKLGPFQNKRLEVRVAAEGEYPRTLGLFRIARVSTSEAAIALPQIIRESNDGFLVTVYVDANGNGEYDDPSAGRGDLGWSFNVKSGAGRELRAVFDPEETASDVDVGPP